MPDAFFQRKRKRPDGPPSGAQRRSTGNSGTSHAHRGPSTASRAAPSRRDKSNGNGNGNGNGDDDDDDDSDGGRGGARAEDMDFRVRDDGLRSDDEAEAAETPAQARVRLAKMYLDRLKDDDELEGPDAVQADKDNIAARLQKDVLEQSGNLHVFLAHRLLPPSAEPLEPSTSASSSSSSRIVHTKGHRLPVTSAVASADAQVLFTASKDGSICQWRLSDGKLLTVIPKALKPNPIPTAASAGSKGKGKAKAKERTVTHPIPKSATSGAARRRMRAQRLTSFQNAGDDSQQDDDVDMKVASATANGTNPKGKSSSTQNANGTSHSDASNGGRMHILRLDEGQGHTDAIWALALSTDGRFLASGGLDRRIGLWELTPSSSTTSSSRPRWVKTLSGHKDSITSLTFRLASSELYSASLDRTLKLFDAAQGSYIETLFGHQDPVLSLSALRSEVAVSAGGRDRTCRWWKIRDESQLVFRAGGKSKVREVLEGGDLARILEKEDAAALAAAGPGGMAADAAGKARIRAKAKAEAAVVPQMSFFEGSVDCVAMIDNQHFLSGGDSGMLALWSSTKKKPIFTYAIAHGLQETATETEGTIATPRWITSLSCLPYGDVFASGSWDGHVRLWALDRQLRSFAPLPFTIEAPGFVNSLQLLTPTVPRTSRAKAAADHSEVVDRRPVMAEKWREERRGPLRVKEKLGDDDEEESDAGMEEESMEEDGLALLSSSKLVNGHVNGNGNGASTATDTEVDAVVVGKKEQEIRGRKDGIAPLLVIGLGQEPRLGRWMRVPEARNGTVIVSFALQA
ncbi:unnamed protein product [Tilletia controversa]|nr:unnamed protein product [Tilletia controversa]CAD6926094.1 unnamed protein product [Tilletia controversa]CAD6977733.1 unnamed protein product [Tilletia controversa]